MFLRYFAELYYGKISWFGVRPDHHPFTNVIKLLELRDEFISLTARNQPWALPPERGTVDAPSISTLVHRRMHHVQQRPQGNSMRGDASCANPKAGIHPLLPFCVPLQYTPFFPPSNVKYSVNVFDTNSQMIQNVHIGVLLLLACGTSASVSLFFATLHKLLAPSGKDFDSSMIFIELLELD